MLNINDLCERSNCTFNKNSMYNVRKRNFPPKRNKCYHIRETMEINKDGTCNSYSLPPGWTPSDVVKAKEYCKKYGLRE